MSLFFAQYLYLLCIYKETGPRTRVSPAPQPLLPQLSDLFQVTQELPVILTDVFVPREIKVFLFNCLFGGGERCFLGVFPKMPKGALYGKATPCVVCARILPSAPVCSRPAGPALLTL